MQELYDFLTFKDPNIKYIVVGCMLITLSAAVVGVFSFLQKKSLTGDVVAHSVLPGICIGFMLSGTKDPLYLITGAFISGWISILLMDFITQKSRVKPDTALGLMLSFFFGVGLLLLTYIQHSPHYPGQSGLDHFLFGSAALIVSKDLYVFSAIAILVLLVVFLFYKEFKLICFDQNFAKAIGIPVKLLNFFLTTLTVLAVVVGIQAVGVVLISSMLITPIAAARFWTQKLEKLLLISVFLGVFSGVAGAFFSYAGKDVPTGPAIVLVASFFAFFSFFFAPQKGIVSRWWKQNATKKNALQERVAVLFENLEIQHGHQAFNFAQLQKESRMLKINLFIGLTNLRSKGYLRSKKGKYYLTGKGRKYAKETHRLYHIWEMYIDFCIKTDTKIDGDKSIKEIIDQQVIDQLSQAGYELA